MIFPFVMSAAASNQDATGAAAAAAPADSGQGAEGEGEARLLVSEFPPPPFYYTLGDKLEPPTIPKEALQRGTRRAAAAAEAARAEAERQRLAEMSGGADVTGALLGGAVPTTATTDEEDGVRLKAQRTIKSNGMDDPKPCLSVTRSWEPHARRLLRATPRTMKSTINWPVDSMNWKLSNRLTVHRCR